MRRGDVRIIQEGDVDVIIEGTVTMSMGGSSSGSIVGGANFISGSDKSAAGYFVSGVTALALRDGGILTSASWGQTIKKGSGIIPPEEVARNGAQRLVDQLAREGLKRR